jgi:hypothetical protein
MRTECINILKKYIIQALITNSGNSLYNIFDGLVQLMQTNWDSSPTTMAELRQNKKTKDKGDLLEHFAYLFFKHVYQNNQQRPSEVYLLNDAPDNVLSKLNLKRHDMGIDLLLRFDKVSFKPGTDNTDRVSGIVSDSLENTEWCAVQVKYRKPNPYKQTFGVSWSDLSTFYALVNRSGPYRKHIVLTNSHYVRHIGKKEFKDQSICIGTLRNISRDEWILMANLTSNFLSGNDAIDKNTISLQTISTDIPLLSISNDEMDTRCTRYEVGANVDTGAGTDTSTNVDTGTCTDTGASASADTSPGTSKDINTDTKVRMQPIIRKTLPIIKIKPRLSPGVLQDLKKNGDKSTSKTPKNVKPTIDELRKLRCAFYGQQEQEKEPQQTNTDTLVNEAKER